ncbi:hypothetical protein ACFW91_21840 [Streptomyces asoensis]|uniref:hypothetical protein n=1 Tax=Streptomyces asoensis TaxID=249586 RepID=UPI00368779AA
MSFTSVRGPVRLTGRGCGLDAFRAPTGRTADLAGRPHATAVEDGRLRGGARPRTAPADRARPAERVRPLTGGPCVVALRGVFPAPAAVDRATAVLGAPVAGRRAPGASAGGHRAKPGADDRVRNAPQRTAPRDTGTFAD